MEFDAEMSTQPSKSIAKTEFNRGQLAPAMSPEGDVGRSLTRGCWLWLSLALAIVFGSTGVVTAQSGAPIAVDIFANQRFRMVEQVRRRGIEQPLLLQAMREVPRHAFVPAGRQYEAYLDQPVETDSGQTIHQAFLSALMISHLELSGGERVLEVGTGSGYDAALLSRVAKEVYTIEIDADLAAAARRTLAELGYDNVDVRTANGYHGLPDKAPFDAILLTVATESIPQPLLDQLKVGGKMVIPVGKFVQDLKVITKSAEGFAESERIKPVRVSPMQGEGSGSPGAGVE